MSLIRTRWAALGAAVAVTLGGGGIGLVSATNPADATTFIAITPCRVMDTRPDPAFNVGPKSSPLGPDEAHAVTAVGNSGDCTAVPASASAVSLNVTALNATQSTFLTIYASNVTRPDASSLNPEPGDPPTPNAVTTELSPGGQFTVFNRFGSVDVIADINGYYVDHNHDDRYYTQGEIDANLFSKTEMVDILPFSVSDSRTDQILLTSTLQTVLSVPIQAKVAGQVTVNSSTAVFHDTAGADVVCFILPAGVNPVAFGTNIPGVQWFESEGPNSNDATISGTRVFNVAANTVTIIELRCAENGGDGGRTFAAELTAIFTASASDL